MADKQRSGWLISPKSFIQLIGAEYELMKRSGSGSLRKFYVSAVLIVIILLISSLSIYYGMKLLFHDFTVEFILAAFISILFVFIYIFLINTFSKGLFHTANDGKGSIGVMGFKISDIIRTGFVIFMGFLISKPLECYCFRSNLDKETASYQQQLIYSYSAKLELLTYTDSVNLQTKINNYQAQQDLFPSEILVQTIQSLKSRLAQLETTKETEIENAVYQITRCDFLLFRIKRVCRSPLAWLFCLAVIIIFLIPGYLIYSISEGDAYFKMKKENESKLIGEEYEYFLQCYRQVFREKLGLEISFSSVFEDPPFNTRRKADKAYAGQDEFLKKYSF
jgi:hypothetical protein